MMELAPDINIYLGNVLYGVDTYPNTTIKHVSSVRLLFSLRARDSKYAKASGEVYLRFIVF